MINEDLVTRHKRYKKYRKEKYRLARELGFPVIFSMRISNFSTRNFIKITYHKLNGDDKE